jgi:hypothetical protein
MKQNFNENTVCASPSLLISVLTGMGQRQAVANKEKLLAEQSSFLIQKKHGFRSLGMKLAEELKQG